MNATPDIRDSSVISNTRRAHPQKHNHATMEAIASTLEGESMCATVVKPEQPTGNLRSGHIAKSKNNTRRPVTLREIAFVCMVVLVMMGQTRVSTPAIAALVSMENHVNYTIMRWTKSVIYNASTAASAFMVSETHPFTKSGLIMANSLTQTPTANTVNADPAFMGNFAVKDI